MGEKQLRLFPPPKPLAERLGVQFFRGIPKQPGVYRMFDGAGRIIYVGQSSNLKDRLNSYRHAHPERDSRKTIRLVHAAQRIEWELCDSPEKALLRENELLRTLRPRFNRMNTYPKACFFVGMAAKADELRLALTRDTSFEGQLYGAFRGVALFAYASLARLLFVTSHEPLSLSQFPPGLLTCAPVREQSFVLNETMQQWVKAFLSGDSAGLLDLLTTRCATIQLETPFEQNLMLGDLVLLEEFFKRGPRRVWELRQDHKIERTWLEPEQLVDLTVLSRGRRDGRR